MGNEENILIGTATTSATDTSSESTNNINLNLKNLNSTTTSCSTCSLTSSLSSFSSSMSQLSIDSIDDDKINVRCRKRSSGTNGYVRKIKPKISNARRQAALDALSPDRTGHNRVKNKKKSSSHKRDLKHHKNCNHHHHHHHHHRQHDYFIDDNSLNEYEGHDSPSNGEANINHYEEFNGEFNIDEFVQELNVNTFLLFL